MQANDKQGVRHHISAACTFEDVFALVTQERYIVYFDISRSDTGQTEVLVEKDSDCHFWHGTVTSEFVNKLNKKFDMDYTQFSLFTKIAKAMISGDPNIVFDWLTTGELTSMMQRAGGPLESPANLQDRVLVMIESRSDKQVSIPISLTAYEDRNHDKFYQVVKRLKQQRNSGSPARKAEGLFLTGADVVQNEELDRLKEENARLERELNRVRAEAKKDPEISTGGGKNDGEIRSLKGQLTELKVELSAIPVLKNQLKEKVKELEVMNMFVREVEICSKIRAPIPNFNSYKKSLLGNQPEDSGRDQPTDNKNRPAVTTNTRGRNINNVGSKNVPGTAPAKRSIERKYISNREPPGVYRANLSGGGSRKASNSSIF